MAEDSSMRLVPGRLGRPAALLAAALALAAAAPGAESHDAPGAMAGAWRAVGPAGGAFRALMPGDPRVRGGSTSTLLGPVRDEVYTLELEGFALAVEHHDFPRIALSLVGADAILDRVARSVVDDLGGTLLSSHPAILAGRPARALRYEVPGARPDLEEARIVLQGRRVYVLTATRPRGAPEPEAFARFFASFELARER